MLRKVRKVIPSESCSTLYNAMILLVIDYCAVIWDSFSKAGRQYLEKLQGRAASIIASYTVSQSQISYTFGWPTLQSRRDYLKCMLVFKSLHGLASAYLLNEFSHARDFRSYNTRHRDFLRLPLARSGTLPLALRSHYNLKKFRFGVKRHLRSKPNWAFNTFPILYSSSIFYLLVLLSFVFVFLFIRAPFKPTSLNWAPLNKYCSK